MDPTTLDGVARLKQLEMLLDRRFSLFGVRFGIDGLIGLVPVAGDVVTGAIGLYIIYEARRLGASKWTISRMLGNWGVDIGVGAVPVVGDLFDIAFKSNTKNVRMLINELEARARKQDAADRKALRVASRSGVSRPPPV